MNIEGYYKIVLGVKEPLNDRSRQAKHLSFFKKATNMFVDVKK